MKLFNRKGFTLIELLVVIAVLGVLAAAVITAINPLGKINAAKDANVKSDISGIASALQSYYTGQNPSAPAYPLLAAGLDDLKITGEVKVIPNQQTPAPACAASPNGYTTGTDYCYVVTATGDQAAVWGNTASSGTNFWCWDSTNAVFKNSATAPTLLAPTCP